MTYATPLTVFVSTTSSVFVPCCSPLVQSYVQRSRTRHSGAAKLTGVEAVRDVAGALDVVGALGSFGGTEVHAVTPRLNNTQEVTATAERPIIDMILNKAEAGAKFRIAAAGKC